MDNSRNCIKIELTEGVNLQKPFNPADLINPAPLTLLMTFSASVTVTLSFATYFQACH